MHQSTALVHVRLHLIQNMLKRCRGNTDIPLKRITQCQDQKQHQADKNGVKKNERYDRRLRVIGPEACHGDDKPENDDKYIDRRFCQRIIQTGHPEV